MKEERARTINEILSEDTSRRTENILERKPVKQKDIITAFVITILVYLLTLLFYSVDIGELGSKTVTFIGQVLTFLCSFCSVSTIIILIGYNLHKSDEKKKFLSYALQNNRNCFRITFTLLFFLSMIKITSWYKNITSPTPIVPTGNNGVTTVKNDLLSDDGKETSEDANKEQNRNINNQTAEMKSKSAEKDQKARLIFQDYLETKYESIISALLTIFASFLIKSLFIQYINYRIHYKYYKERIRKNNKIVKYLQNLNNVTGMPADDDVNATNNAIFDTMRGRKPALTLDDFRYHFGPTDGTRIFTLFDIDENSEVSREEFTRRYSSLLTEKAQLDTALLSNSSSIRKLDIVISLIIYPVTIALTLFCIDAHEKFANIFRFLTAILLSVSFAFSAVVSSTFQSIIFVFFVRPFDIGDIIEYDGKTFYVSDLGLLYSTFLSDSRYETVPNDELRKKSIKNFRKSTHATVKYTYSVPFSNLSRIDSIKERINTFLLDNPTKYQESCRIINISHSTAETVEFTIEIVVSCPYQEMHTLEERKDRFSVFVMKEMDKMGIKGKQK